MGVGLHSALASRKQDILGKVEQHSACPGSEAQIIQEVVHVNSWCLFMHRQGCFMSHANKRTFLECHFGLFVVLATGMLQIHVYVNTHVKNGEECKVGVIARDVLCLRHRQMHTVIANNLIFSPSVFLYSPRRVFTGGSPLPMH